MTSKKVDHVAKSLVRCGTEARPRQTVMEGNFGNIDGMKKIFAGMSSEQPIQSYTNSGPFYIIISRLV